MLKLRNIEAGYGKLKVLRHVTMHVSAGEIVSIIGANGAGKTTLLSAVAGLVRTWDGSMTFRDSDIRSARPEDIVMMGCSMVPEGRQVFATMTVMENLELGSYVQYKRGKSGEVRDDMEKMFSIFPVLKERSSQLAGTLSGGEQQMLATARALMARPSLLMLDEPSMGLAPLIVKEIFRIIRMLRDEGSTVLLVEQNARAALAISDRGYVLENGRIIEQGKAEELLNNREVQRAYLGKDADF